MKKIIYLFAVLLFASCNDFLDEQPKGRIIPETVEDLALMMYDLDLNSNGNQVTAGISHNMFLGDDVEPASYFFGFYSESDRNLFAYRDEVFNISTDDEDLNSVYHSIYICNFVIQKIDDAEQGIQYFDKDYVKATALSNRAFQYLQLVTTYAPFYSESAATDLAIPMPLIADINTVPEKSTVKEVYDQIEKDLLASLDHLKDVEETHLPSKQSAYGLLARFYMYQKKYDDMLEFAELSLEIKNELFDYHQILYGTDFFMMGYPGSFLRTYTYPETILSRIGKLINLQYSEDLLNDIDQVNDLRFKHFSSFIDLYNPTGGPIPPRNSWFYDTSMSLTKAEVLLMAAEGHLRATNKDISKAKEYLNLLKSKRYMIPVPTTSEVLDEVLSEVMKERRIELRMKGHRWLDMKRLGINKTITRTLGDETITYDTSVEYFVPLPANVTLSNPNS